MLRHLRVGKPADELRPLRDAQPVCQALQFRPARAVADDEQAGRSTARSDSFDQRRDITSGQEIPDIPDYRSRQSEALRPRTLRARSEDGGVHPEGQTRQGTRVPLLAKDLRVVLSDGERVIDPRQHPALHPGKRRGKPLVDILGGEEADLRLSKMAAGESHDLIGADISGLAQEVDDIGFDLSEQAPEATGQDLRAGVAAVVGVRRQGLDPITIRSV